MAAMPMVCGSTLAVPTFVFLSLLFSTLRLGVTFKTLRVSVAMLGLG